MTDLLLTSAAALLLTLAIGMVRVLRGPDPGDRMLAAQLIGTAGVGVLLLLAAALGLPSLVDVALVLALLAAVAVVAFTRREETRAGD
ncbi:MAG: monovalent cation/H+ antiporter complex subunit F [Chromatiales bacterium]